VIYFMEEFKKFHKLTGRIKFSQQFWFVEAVWPNDFLQRNNFEEF